MKKTLVKVVLFALLVGVVALTSAAICVENPEIYCGFRCVSNSCISDSASRPDDACWFLWFTQPVQCDWQDDYEGCGCDSGI